MQEFKGYIRDYLALERPYDARPRRGRTSRSTPSPPRPPGVDPHISQANARIQAQPRSPQVRGIPLDRVNELIDENTDGRALGLLGEPGVNVLELNLALDEEQPDERHGRRPARRRAAQRSSMFDRALLSPR